MTTRHDILETPPPNSVESEMALLGALILDPAMVAEVLPMVGRDGAFFDERHAAIFAAMRWLFEKGDDWDAVELAERLRSAGKLEGVGGTAYLGLLARSIPSSVNATHYARLVAEKHRARGLVAACWETLEHVHNPTDGATAEDIEQAALARVYAATDDAAGEKSQHIADVAQECLRAIDEGRSEYYRTGFGGFDDYYGGFPKQGLVTVIAPPGHGKSTWVLNAVVNIAADHPVRLFSYEMPANRITEAVLARECRLPVRSYTLNGVRPGLDQWGQLEAGALALRKYNLEVVDDYLDARDIFARCYRYRSQGVRVVVVDYLQNLPQLKGQRDSFGSLAESAQILQKIARRLGLCVVMVCQGTAEADRRARAMGLGDAYGGAPVKQVTDVGLSLFRPGLFDPEVHESVTELHVVKNKYGPVTLGKPIPLEYAGAYAAFTDTTPFDGADDA
jgi:replicative DNA helicase